MQKLLLRAHVAEVEFWPFAKYIKTKYVKTSQLTHHTHSEAWRWQHHAMVVYFLAGGQEKWSKG